MMNKEEDLTGLVKEDVWGGGGGDDYFLSVTKIQLISLESQGPASKQ